jgi:hypothetical protein
MLLARVLTCIRRVDLQGCDASVMVASTANNTAEKDHPINLSLAGDGFDTVIRAKAAVDAAPGCRGKVSCADILAMATRDAIALVRTHAARVTHTALQVFSYKRIHGN